MSYFVFSSVSLCILEHAVIKAMTTYVLTKISLFEKRKHK